MPKDARQIPLTIGPSGDYGWLGGLALNKYIGNKASYLASGGIDPFRNPGVLQTGFVASVLTTSVRQQITGMDFYNPVGGGAARIAALGNFGEYYDINTETLAVNSALNLSMTNNDYGFAIFRNAAFFTRNEGVSITRLTRNNLTTVVNQSVAAELNSSMISSVNGVQIKHVLLPWKSNLYCLHANNIDYLDGNGANSGILTIGARLLSGMVVKTATSYGEKIAIGASDNLTQGSNAGTVCRVYFYDGFSNDWQKETVFPETDILNLVYHAGNLIGYGYNNSYVYNTNTGGWDIYKPLDSGALPLHNSHSISKGQIWFYGDGSVKTYGSPTDVLPNAFHAPIVGAGAGQAGVGAGICRWLNEQTLYASASPTGGLLSISSGFKTNVRFRSRSISADGTKFRFAWIRIVTEVLTTSDQATVEIVDNSGTSYTIGTLNGATSSDGAIFSKEFFAKDFTSEPPYMMEAQLSLLFSAGNVKVRRVDMILETAPEY